MLKVIVVAIKRQLSAFAILLIQGQQAGVDAGACWREMEVAVGHLDADYVNEVMARLALIPADAVPRWGRLRRDTLLEHLIRWGEDHTQFEYNSRYTSRR